MTSKNDVVSVNAEDDIQTGNTNFKLHQDGTYKGLDENAAKTWIFPTNLPCRQYQFDIIETALFHNTLVSLPTGLGKTMIAAVVMYNIYRWYPLGRVIFMAPTRPLVSQQAEACRTITCIPSDHTTLLTGNVQSSNRSTIWNTKRVIFLTPQILQKDLESKICPVDLIRCVVIDEAHRARGKYAYCEVMRLLGDRTTSQIRILALSATPGATVKQVSEVVQALKIARLEIRTEDSADVRPYVFNKIIETEIVKLGEPLLSFREKYILILDHYTRRLMKAGVLTGSAGNIHKGRIFMVQKEYKAYCQRSGKKPDGFIQQDLSFCLTLYHAFEVLTKHGLRGFLSFYNEGGNKNWIRKDNNLSDLLNEIREYLKNDELKIEILPDGTYPEIDPQIVFGHPKYYKLRDLVKNHFAQQPDTRVMIFCEYRDSVQEAFGALLTCRPLVRPRMFLGQSAISQKQQLSVMEKFRSGDCNTLICTCVAEEGLDVASVQLIICFDIANRSPVRLAQRMGRTGRHQVGKIVMLVTEGREQQTLEETLHQSSLLDVRLVQNPMVQTNLIKAGPSLFPNNIQPECNRLHLTLLEPENKKKKKSTKSSVSSVTWNTKDPVPEFQRVSLNSNVEASWNKSKNDYFRAPGIKVLENFAKSFKSEVNYRGLVEASTNSLLLQNLYKDAQSLKYNLSTFEKTKVPVKTKNQDIRNLLAKNVREDNNDFVPSVQPPTTSTTSSSWKTFIINYMAELNKRNTLKMLLDQTCMCCDQLGECSRISRAISLKETEISPSFPPNESIFKCLTYENLSQVNTENLFEPSAYHFDFEKYNQEKRVSRLCATYTNEVVDDFDFSSQYFKVPAESFETIDQTPTEATVADFKLPKAPKPKVSEKVLSFKENQYEYDTFGKEALSFFGLNLIEDLFDGDISSWSSESNLKIDAKKTKKPNTIDLYFSKNIERPNPQELTNEEFSRKNLEVTPREIEKESSRYPGIGAQDESIVEYVLRETTCEFDNTDTTMNSPTREDDSNSHYVLSPIISSQRRIVKSRYFNSQKSSQKALKFSTKTSQSSSEASQNSQKTTQSPPKIPQKISEPSPKTSQPSPKASEPPNHPQPNVHNLAANIADLYNYESDDDMFADDTFENDLFKQFKFDTINQTENNVKVTIISPKIDIQKEKKTSLSLRKNLESTDYDSADESLLSFCSFKKLSKIKDSENIPPPNGFESSNDKIETPKLVKDITDLTSFACSKNGMPSNSTKSGSSTLASKLLFNHNNSENETNSDDDFANFVIPKETPKQNKIAEKCSLNIASPNISNGRIDSDLGLAFEEDFTLSQMRSSPRTKRAKSLNFKRRKRRKCTFIDDEAAHSEDDDNSDLEEEDEDISFVVDLDEDDPELVDLHPIYLKTTKSPIKTTGAFKIPQLPPVKLNDICSQIDWKNDENYVEDSFVSDTIVVNDEISYLEQVEMELERKRKKKRTKGKCGGRIIVLSSDSSDEEVELRKCVA